MISSRGRGRRERGGNRDVQKELDNVRKHEAFLAVNSVVLVVKNTNMELCFFSAIIN